MARFRSSPCVSGNLLHSLYIWVVSIHLYTLVKGACSAVGRFMNYVIMNHFSVKAGYVTQALSNAILDDA